MGFGAGFDRGLRGWRRSAETPLRNTRLSRQSQRRRREIFVVRAINFSKLRRSGIVD